MTLLLNLLKAFGLDIPARVAELKARIEQRVEDAADQAVHVVQDIAVTVALVCCAAITALAAIAVGLVALARWVADLYGPFAGLAAVGGILLLVTVILAVVAVRRPRSARREVLQSAAKRSATYADAARRLHAAQAEPAQAGGLTSPAASTPQGGAGSSMGDFGKLIGFLLPLLTSAAPASGGGLMGTLSAAWRSGAHRAAGETLEGAAKMVREGDRTNLLAAVGAAVLFGWLVSGRTFSWASRGTDNRSGTMERQKNEFGLGAEGASASAGGQMKDWQRSGAEALSRGKEAASAAGAEAASSGASAVQSLRSEIKNIQDMVTRLAAQSGREAVDSARHAAAAAAERVGDVAGDLARSSADAAAAATDRAKSVAGELEGMARRNPMGVIAGAVVIGVLIGVFGRRS
ncbi:MAG TPA: hypothetical protein VNY79_09745 [Xanthobacteraceae bacterium]|nr:hypothetical protein [Xanthobacteraceae bacterium]